ncbi:transcription-repair coupling factor [Alginatibacterium sediminis]|uniref:Transcription-repair-coupling factor n=1 Tax=Alginatibacterium sediminis TaxID=2164068 RepID=A0A420EFW0_9ALTE|nr:transcription-repair coupling factor [Alginatibacterium sediminis]RKF19543.1 transcription-repair coupling factor [Alginatibacterium sediminis]
MTQISVFSKLPLPKSKAKSLGLANLPGCSKALVLHRYIEQIQRPIVILSPDTREAIELHQALHILSPQRDIHLLPDWETLPYDTFSPHQDIISQRLLSLHQLASNDRSVIIAPINTWLQRCAPMSYLRQYSLMLKSGQNLDLEAFRNQLSEAGYKHVTQVMEHGEFAVRGSLLDLYPMGSQQPYRLDFFDDELESIRLFDPDTQRSGDHIEHIELLPAHEFPTNASGIDCFRANWRSQFEVSHAADSIYQQVSKGLMPAGIEYYLPLFHSEVSSFNAQLNPNTLLIESGNLHQAAQEFWTELRQRYENRRFDVQRPILAPEQLYQSVDECFGELKNLPRIALHELEAKASDHHVVAQALPDLSVNHRLQEPLQALRQFLESWQGQVVFVVQSAGRREALSQLLKPLKLNLKALDQVAGLAKSKQKTLVLQAPFLKGACFDERYAFICESDLLGDRVIKRARRASSKVINPDALVRNLAELSIGQPVVHIEHGVGRYQGLTTIENSGIKTEFLVLEYANQAKLYVPVSSLQLISRYSGSGEDNAPLNKLGSDKWDKTKRKAAEKIRDVAAELLNIYASRAAKPGHKFEFDELSYQQFCSEFPFEETDDQLQAIDATLLDMRSANAMDRLVCGDVGFGKTEVALRAAFVSVLASKQVAVLVPTTLLAQQHFDNFCDRFANWPVRVEVLSRFKTAKQQTEIIAEIAAGQVDIVIGTHKLLSKDIKYKDLGLLVVDEEHRFGVRQKEQIKALRADVDILTLTATPIPRTLNMAMSGMRDLSIIATPPAKRLAVKTFVREYDKPLIKEAISREIMRGGQVYFLNNKVENIEKVAEELQTMVPSARIAVAHGQMRERELERIMGDFHHQRFNVLVCTTIIETGIDIPSANTIIINRADNFGLAQLHQLRGRVGRSHHQAYAYLLTPPPKGMTKDAVKRLDAIAQLEDLGAGFTLATHDLEIRGAGELLGDDQSGQIEAIGFTLYMDMLERAVDAMKAGKEIETDVTKSDQCELELRIAALLPDDYVIDVTTRLNLYKRMANCRDSSELRELNVELIDRFGLVPDPGKNLIRCQAIKITANELGIERIDAHAKGGSIEFGMHTKVDAGYLISLLQSQPAIFRLDGANKLKFNVPTTNADERLTRIEDLLEQLKAHAN